MAHDLEQDMATEEADARRQVSSITLRQEYQNVHAIPKHEQNIPEGSIAVIDNLDHYVADN